MMRLDTVKPAACILRAVPYKYAGKDYGAFAGPLLAVTYFNPVTATTAVRGETTAALDYEVETGHRRGHATVTAGAGLKAHFGVQPTLERNLTRTWDAAARIDAVTVDGATAYVGPTIPRVNVEGRPVRAARVRRRAGEGGGRPGHRRGHDRRDRAGAALRRELRRGDRHRRAARAHDHARQRARPRRRARPLGERGRRGARRPRRVLARGRRRALALPRHARVPDPGTRGAGRRGQAARPRRHGRPGDRRGDLRPGAAGAGLRHREAGQRDDDGRDRATFVHGRRERDRGRARADAGARPRSGPRRPGGPQRPAAGPPGRLPLRGAEGADGGDGACRTRGDQAGELLRRQDHEGALGQGPEGPRDRALPQGWDQAVAGARRWASRSAAGVADRTLPGALRRPRQLSP